MYKNKKILAIVAAAGNNTKMIGKDYTEYENIDDKPLLAYSLNVLQRTDYIDYIYLIVNEEDMEFCKDSIINRYNLTKINKIIKGGKTRQESILKALNAIDHKVDYILTHNASRPFIKEETLDRLIKSIDKNLASVLALPSRENIKIVADDGRILSTPDKATLYLTQTPQIFLSGILLSAYQNADEYGLNTKDDSNLVELLGFPVNIVNVDRNNIDLKMPLDYTVTEVIKELGNEKLEY